MTLLKIIDGAAILAGASLLFYAFTGLTLWSPLQNNNPGDAMLRSTVLLIAHIAPLLIAIVRRAP